MTYEQELTFQLRLRGRGEDEIAETIREIRAHGTDPAALREEFGTPAEYAEGFEKRGRRSLGYILSAVATVLAVCWLLTWVATAAVRRFALGIEDAGAGFPPLLPVAAAIVLTGLLAGFLIDRLRPPQRV